MTRNNVAGRLWLMADWFGSAFGNMRIMMGFATASIAKELAVKTAIPDSTAKMLRIIISV